MPINAATASWMQVLRNAAASGGKRPMAAADSVDNRFDIGGEPGSARQAFSRRKPALG